MAFDDTQFLALADRDPADLTGDETATLKFFYSAHNVRSGLLLGSPDNLWCQQAERIDEMLAMAELLPWASAEPLRAEAVSWIQDQHSVALNTYQRARIQCMLDILSV